MQLVMVIADKMNKKLNAVYRCETECSLSVLKIVCSAVSFPYV